LVCKEYESAGFSNAIVVAQRGTGGCSSEYPAGSDNLEAIRFDTASPSTTGFVAGDGDERRTRDERGSAAIGSGEEKQGGTGKTGGADCAAP